MSTAELVKKLTDISEEAQRIAESPNMDEAKIKSSLKLMKSKISDLLDLTRSLQGTNAQELRNMITTEISRLEQKINSKEKLLKEGNSKIGDVIFPSVMNIAGAVKFYIQSADNHIDERANEEQDYNEEINATPGALKRSRSQLTLDIMSFARACSAAITCLKGTPIDRKVLLTRLTAILSSVKALVTDDYFSNVITKSYMVDFVEMTKQIKSMDVDNLTGNPIVNKLLQTLTPLASEVKKAAFELQNAPETPQAEHRPLHYHHDALQPSAMFGSVSTITESMSSSFSLHDFSKRDSNASLASNSKRMSTLNSSMNSPISAEHRHPRVSALSPRMTSFSYSSPNLLQIDSPLSSMNSSNESLLEEVVLASLSPIKVDIVGDQASFQVEIEAKYNYMHTEKYAYKKKFVKSETKIQELWNRIDELLPGYLPSFSFDSIKKYPSKTQMQEMVLGEYAIFFQAVNAKPYLLKSHHLISFLNENQVVASPSKSPSSFKTPTISLEASFFTTLITKPDNKHATYAKDDPPSPITEKPHMSRTSSIDSISSSKRSSTNESQSKFGSNLFKSKSLFLNLGSQKEEKRPKSDPAKRSVVTKSQALLDRPANDTYFKDYTARLLKAGFVKVNDNYIVYRDASGAEKVAIKNVNGQPRIVSAPLNDLIKRVLEESLTNDELFHCFVLTYRHLMKPHELLIKLIEYYKSIATADNAHPEVGQMQVASFLGKWVETSWADFENDVNLKNGLEKFMSIIKSSKKVALMADQISATIVKQREIYLNEKKLDSAVPERPFVTNVGAAEFISLDVYNLGVQMTKFDHEMLTKIRPIGLLEYLWDKHSSTVNSWINRFNLVSYWVGTEICTTPLLKQRIMVMENMIKLLKVFKDLNNFNGIMAVISGLNMASTRRLKKTWAGLSAKSISNLHEIEKMMDPQMNYQNYRDIEAKCRHQLSFIPFLGLYLKDLTFANDGNPKYLANDIVNFTKNWQIYDIIKKIMQAKEVPYEFPQDDQLYGYCAKLVSLPEKRLYSYSLLCEPKDNKTTTSSNPLSVKDSSDSTMRLIEKWSSK